MSEQQILKSELLIVLRELGRALLVDGGVMEMGCYVGDTSVEMARILKDTGKKLWLYDSFEGLPEKSPKDTSALGDKFRVGELVTSKADLVRRFKKAGLPMPVVKKAWFSDLRDVDLPEKICFAFLDGDYYDSIRDSLRLVQNKMVKGGAIVVHDYGNDFLPGVRRAVDEWLVRCPHKIRVVGQTLIVIQC